MPLSLIQWPISQAENQFSLELRGAGKMKLTNQQLENFVNRIRLSRDEKGPYAPQIDKLKSNVISAINGMPETKVTRVRRAGSWIKGTALKPRDGFALDVDMVFFLDVSDEMGFDAEELREEVISVLCEAYPNKTKDDFTEGQKTIGVVFRGSGLEVDIVPFVPYKTNPMYGRQPRKALNSGEFKTSVDKQLEFIQDIKDRCQRFTSIVALLKRWRDYQEVTIPSFAIELVIAHLVINNCETANIEYALVNFFEFISAPINRNLMITFPNAHGHALPTSIPHISDPTNNENNVLEKTEDWNGAIKKAEAAFETLCYAQARGGLVETIEPWKEIMGPNFNIEDA